MDSITVREFSMALQKYIFENKLPAEVKRYVVADIYNSLNSMADTEIALQLKEREGKNE